MKLKYVQDEDIVNYKKCSMFIAMPYCSFKCEKDCGVKCCQNSSLAKAPVKEIDTKLLIDLYKMNKFTSAVVFGGLEPFDSWDDLLEFVTIFRNKLNDDIVIYTGYYEDEIQDRLEELSKYSNIIVKFGRYIPGHDAHYDPVLGVKLASDNQFAKKLF